MKMVKKCLISIAVVALLAATVQAADNPMKFDGTWPWTKIYEPVGICDVPVYLEVGHYVQVKDCGEDWFVIKLEQVVCSTIGKEAKHFPCYSDCVSFEARANFEATFGGDFSASDLGLTIITDKEVYYDGGDTIAGDGGWHALKLCMKAWNVKLWESGVTSGAPKVGTITITVKPQTETGGSW